VIPKNTESVPESQWFAFYNYEPEGALHPYFESRFDGNSKAFKGVRWKMFERHWVRTKKKRYEKKEGVRGGR
jgi:hypothetical protein